MSTRDEYAEMKDELARIITAGLCQGITEADLLLAQRGDRSIGNYIADAILAMGFKKAAR